MTPDQTALIRKAQESLEAARLLAGKGFTSFAASRAYYAMFYATEALLLGEEITYSKHSAVIAAFGQLFAKTGRIPKEYHRYLIEAEGIRNVGDYDIHSSLTGRKLSSIWSGQDNLSKWQNAFWNRFPLIEQMRPWRRN